MPKIVTIFWRDIPAQVTAKEGRKRAKKLLAVRFQEAIDRAAMRAKKSDADSYLDDWRRESGTMQGNIEELVEEVANTLEVKFTNEILEAIVRNNGLDPNANSELDSESTQ